MPTFKINTTIREAIGTVYQAFIDIDNMLRWTKYLENIEIEKGAFGEIGATMRLHYNQDGRKSVLVDKLIFLDPGKLIKSRVTGEGLKIDVETKFEAFNNDTSLTMIWNGQGSNILMTAMLILMQRKIKKGAEAEINLFKALVEEHGVRFP